MKRCPKCNFSFPDFHHTCDFDGADLVDDPQTQHGSPRVTALAAATQTPFRRLVKSPVFLMVLLLACLFSSLLLIVYHDAAPQPNSIAESKAPRDSSDRPPADAAAQDRTQSPSANSEIKAEAAKDLSSTRAPSVTASRLRTRLRTSPSIRNKQSRPEIALRRQPKDKALQRESKENPNRKESKLTAALKTTWNILKKPFKF